MVASPYERLRLRLVSKTDCRGVPTSAADDAEIDMEQVASAGLSEEEVKSYRAKKGQGCGACSDTGFKGRVAIYEVMVMTDQLKEFVLNGASGAEIKLSVDQERAAYWLGQGAQPSERVAQLLKEAAKAAA